MNESLQQAALWTWQNSLAAGLLALLFLALRRTFRDRIGPAWLCLAGWLVFVRLFLPVPASHPWALDRLWSGTKQVLQATNVQAPEQPVANAVATRTSAVRAAENDAATSFAPAAETAAPAPPASAPQARAASAGKGSLSTESFTKRPASWPLLFGTILWLGGAGIFFAVVVIRHFRFVRNLKRISAPLHFPWPELFTECAQAARLHRAPRLFTVPGSGTPFLCGALRPHIIFPADTLARISEPEARHILLHEMLHAAKRDLLINWLIAAARALHWFNPLVHTAFSRWSADREVLRDRQALRLLTEPAQRAAYGCTLLKLALPAAAPVLSPGIAPLFRSEKELKRRIIMLQSPHRPRRLAAFTAAAILAAASGLLFTSARGQAQNEPQTPRAVNTAENPPVPGETPAGAGTRSAEAAPPAEAATQRLHAIAARLRAKGQAEEAAAIELELGRLEQPQPARADARIDALSLEIQRLRQDFDTAKKASVDLQSRKQDLDLELVRSQSEADTLKKLTDDEQIQVWATQRAQDPVTAKFYPEFQLALAELKTLQKEMGPNHPRILAAQSKIDQLRGILGRSVRQYSQSLATNIASLNAQRKAIEDMEANGVTVLGEVRKPGRFPHQAQFTLGQVIGLAGGFTEFARADKVKIIRVKGGGKEEITVNAAKDGPAFQIQPKDVIQVLPD